MKRKTKGFATAAAFCTAAAAGLVAVGALATQSSSTSAANTAAATAASTASTAVVGGFTGPEDVCTRNLSKDLCEGRLSPGQVSTGSCIFGIERCETTHVTGAEWVFSLASNTQSCGNARCDQVPQKDGRLIAKVDYTQRTSDPCPYRACITGSWTYYATDGSVYEGRLIGTMAAGTHRPSECSFGDRDCERCLDANLQSFFSWRIGTEVSFFGTRVDADTVTRDELCFSLSGDFIAPTSPNSPTLGGAPDNRQPWRFAGTADGVHIGCP